MRATVIFSSKQGVIPFFLNFIDLFCTSNVTSEIPSTPFDAAAVFSGWLSLATHNAAARVISCYGVPCSNMFHHILTYTTRSHSIYYSAPTSLPPFPHKHTYCFYHQRRASLCCVWGSVIAERLHA